MKHLYYSTTLCYCQTLSLHEYLSKCLKKGHLKIVVLFSPYDNAKCTKTEQGFRTCNILQTAPHRLVLLSPHSGLTFPPRCSHGSAVVFLFSLCRSCVYQCFLFDSG